MASRLNPRMFVRLALVVAAVCAIVGPPAVAALTVDLRATGTTSGTVVNPKQVLFTGGPGDTVTMDVYSVVTGGVNSIDFDDYLDELHGSFLSSLGGLRGNLKAQLVSNYIDFISYNGLPQDLDGDGDLDIGSNNEPSLANFFRAYRWREAPTIPEARIATLTWTNTVADPGTNTLVNFRPRNVANGAQWAVDGYGVDPSFGVFTSGGPVTISLVPEASVLTLPLLVLQLRNRPTHRKHQFQQRQGNKEVRHAPHSNHHFRHHLDRSALR